MGTDFWVRNPTGCIREVIAAGENKIVFDEGYMGRRNHDPFSFLKLYFGEGADYEMLLIRPHGASHYLSSDLENPVGVYPVWNASVDSITWLEEWCAKPLGNDKRLCSRADLSPDQRPVYGQENRIVIHGIPDAKTIHGKETLRVLRDINLDYPDVKFVIHGLYIFVPLINLGFAEFTFEPREAAAHKAIFLPVGRKVLVDSKLRQHEKWIELLGFTLGQMQEPKARCTYNVKAARWACQNTKNPVAFIQKPSDEDSRPNPMVPNENYVPRGGGKSLARVDGLPGDKIDCDTCSLIDSCKYYREGSVCTLPGSEMTELAKLFDTTDSRTILDGMAKLTAMSVNRLEKAMAFEDDFGLDPDVTKMLKQTFDIAERYAKLNDPMLRASVSFNNNRNGSELPGKAQPAIQLTPREAAAAAIAYYENQGIPRAQITSEMMGEFLRLSTAQPELAPAPQRDNEPQDAEVVSE